MGRFAGSGLRDKKVSERGVYFGNGHFKAEIKKAQVITTRKNGDAIVVDFTVLESDNPEHPAGVERTWFQGLKDQDVAFDSLKKFMYAVLGYDDFAKAKAEVDPQIEELMDAAVSAENILKGKKVSLEVFTIKTKEKGLDFSKHIFAPFAKAAEKAA